MESKYDAELSEWVFEEPVILGRIKNDSKGRFADGTFIRTSIVVHIEDGIAQTLNTRYKLA